MYLVRESRPPCARAGEQPLFGALGLRAFGLLGFGALGLRA